MMTRREFGFVCTVLHASHSLADEPRRRVTVQVLQLLKPTQVTVRPAGNGPIEVSLKQVRRTLWPGHSATLVATDAPFSAQAHIGSEDAFLRLTLPGGFTRDYLGRLSGEMGPGDELILIIDMSVETAVRSIVGAELPTHGVALAALAAQAVVARSFLIAGGRRHDRSDFCDTTHCQFLRSPAAPRSGVAIAAQQTCGLVLTANGKPFPPLYSAACGGETEQRQEAGYLYQRVACEVCAASHRTRSGHGLGLCQNAALTLAQRGWPWQRILRKYYPGTGVHEAYGS